MLKNQENQCSDDLHENIQEDISEIEIPEATGEVELVKRKRTSTLSQSGNSIEPKFSQSSNVDELSYGQKTDLDALASTPSADGAISDSTFIEYESLCAKRAHFGLKILHILEKRFSICTKSSIFWRENLLSSKVGTLSQSLAELVTLNHLLNANWRLDDLNIKSRIFRLISPSNEPYNILNLTQLPQQSLCFEMERQLQNSLLESLTSCRIIQTSRFPLGIHLRTALSNQQRPLLLEALKARVCEWIENNRNVPDHKIKPLFVTESSLSKINANPNSSVITQHSCSLYPYTNHYHFKDALLEVWPIKKIVRKDTDPLISYLHSHTLGSSLLERIKLLLNNQRVVNSRSNTPLIVSLVSFEHQNISYSSWRNFFFGPSKERLNDGYLCDANQFRGWFQNPMHDHVAGFLFFTPPSQPKTESSQYNCCSILNHSEDFCLSPQQLLPTTGLYTLKKVNHDPLVAEIK